ncbi:MAG: hypothetical protein AAF547_06520 [Actinomycetota bacterium]
MSLWSGTYSRLPHGFWDHAKVLEVGVPTAVFFLRMTDFADRNMTDGIITDSQLRALGQPRAVRMHTARLQSACLLQRVDVPAGWEIVDFLDGHATRAQIEAKREKARSAGVRSGEARRNRAATEPPETDDDTQQFVDALLDPEQSSTEQVREQRRRARSTQDSGGPRLAAAAVVKILYGDRSVLMTPRDLVDAAQAEGVTSARVAAVMAGWCQADLEAVAVRAAAEARNPVPYWLTIVAGPPPTFRLETAKDIAEFFARHDAREATA